MLRALLRDARFCQCLVALDREILEVLRGKGCPHCQAPLDRADFPRKVNPTNLADETAFATRFALCCRAEGCRRRLLPPSVRFFGARQTPMPTFLLATLVLAPLKARSIRRLCAELGVTASTLRRWRTFVRRELRDSLPVTRLRARSPGFGVQARSFVRLWFQIRSRLGNVWTSALALLCALAGRGGDISRLFAGFCSSAEFGG